jgi:carbon-monoxide dehydrogenase large subunit
MTFPNGAHIVEVEIDRDTGQVALSRYTAADDAFPAIANAVADALAAGGATDLAGPATPQQIWRAIRAR